MKIKVVRSSADEDSDIRAIVLFADKTSDLNVLNDILTLVIDRVRLELQREQQEQLDAGSDSESSPTPP